VALRAVERDAVRVTGLVLANTQPAADGNEAKLRRADGIRKLRAEGVVHYVDNFLSAALSPHTHEHHPDVIANARKLMLDSGIDGMASALVALAARTDSTESLAQIKVPTLVVAGEHDLITPVKVMRAMADKIPNVTFEVVPNAGHLSNLEAPDLFNQLLMEHVQRVVQNAK
jgi:pimeloyl-ACP methyl ester carboxylesterase